MCPAPAQAICGYRETERALGGAAARALLGRLAAAFPRGRPPAPLVHVLDLHPRGHVRPHVDSVKVGPQSPRNRPQNPPTPKSPPNPPSSPRHPRNPPH